jgi:AraC family transcriptional regulator
MMDEVIEKAVERVIRSMREQLGEPITIDDMARTAMFSKFHFSRMFQRVTGISPGRFLSAMRLQEAKKLLLSTSSTVAEISHQVGYNSIGTFSSRFRSSVGVSPTEYRQLGGYTHRLSTHVPRGDRSSATVRGHLWPPQTGQPGPIFIGLFPDRIAQGRPVRCTIRRSTGPFMIEDVPVGSWHIMAHAAPADYDELRRGPAIVDEQERFVAAHGPIVIRPDTAPRPVDMWMRPRCIFDPPVLLAPLDLRAVPYSTVVSVIGHRWPIAA